jgi:hypothetical protein
MRMKTRVAIGLLLAVAMIAGCTRSENQDAIPGAPAAARNAETPRARAAQETGESFAAEALRKAADNDAYLFIFFFKSDDEPTRLARKALESIVKDLGRSAEWTVVDITSPAEAAIVNTYNVRTSPMPLVLAVAPNGAVTGGFRSADIKEEQLKSAIASHGMQKCMKGLQDRKIVFVCVQGKRTQFNKEALLGVEDFKADARYAAYTEIVTVDPSDPTEERFLGQLKIDRNAKEAATAFLAPPNIMLGVTKGPTSKASFINMLASASSGCGPKGCGPSGCGPTK